MADVPLTDVEGTPKYFVTEGIVSGTITSGQTGNLLTVAESGNKVYRIKLLTSNAGSQSGISLTVNGNVIESEKTLVTTNASVDTQFSIIKNLYNSSSPDSSKKVYDVVECTSFSLDKNAGNTSEAIDYSYEIGEYL